METVNILKFLNSVKKICALDYWQCDENLVNFLDLMVENEQFTQRVDLGVIFINQRTPEKYIIVDGVNRILSLSLLLHSICEVYKKTTPRNEKAIKTIRSKYLISGSHLKLLLPDKEQAIYNKIINGEKLSGHEKDTSMFRLLHNFWSQIKEENLEAARIFAMLQKIQITIVETDDVSQRNLYYKLNYAKKLNQMYLINDYFKEKNLASEWSEVQQKYFPRNVDIELFLKDFFITKFNYKQFNPSRLYESMVNYFETMMLYTSKENAIQKIQKSARLYFDILNVNFSNDTIRQAFINIKKYSGEDTFAYILDVYEDFCDGNIAVEVFVEILNTICEYVKARKNSANNTDFNELINYLNAFITCK